MYVYSNTTDIMVLFNLLLSFNLFNHFYSHSHPQNNPMKPILLFAFTDGKIKGYRIKDGKWRLREGNDLPKVMLSGEVRTEMPD